MTCPPALAAPLPPPPETRAEEDVQPLLKRAVALFDERQFDEAIALFEEAYAIDPEANYLFNIGRVYEEKGDLETALVYYTRFVEHPEAAAEAKAMTTERIARLQAQLPPPPGIDAPAPEPPPPRLPATNSETALPSTDLLPATSDPLPTAPPAPKRLRIAGYSLLGAGAAVLVTAAGFAGFALVQHRRLDELSTLDLRNDAIERGQRGALVADSLFIAGGIVAITGLTLTLASLRGRKSASRRP